MRLTYAWVSGYRGNAVTGFDRGWPGVVGGQGELGGAELVDQVGHQVGLGVDRFDRVERVGEAVGGGGGRHELGYALRPGRRRRRRG